MPRNGVLQIFQPPVLVLGGALSSGQRRRRHGPRAISLLHRYLTRDEYHEDERLRISHLLESARGGGEGECVLHLSA